MRWSTIGCIALLLGCIDRQIDDGETQASETGDGDGDSGPNPEVEQVVDDLQRIMDGAAAYFQIEQPEMPLHRCPHPSGSVSGGEAGITPDIGFNCYLGPEQKCVPAQGGGGAGFYDTGLWINNSVWSGIGFEKTEPHAFHYNFIMTNAIEGYGDCSFTARAFADLDDDAIFSTYERRGSADEQGIHIDPMLYVSLPTE
jgi:hypothetical protein